MELIGNVNLSDSTNYQVVYSSQLYGTFFSVFAKFKCTSKEDEYTMQYIDFIVINYKGLLDIGITNIKSPLDFSKPPSDIGHVFNLEMRALGGSKNYNLPCAGLVINKDERIIIERTLLPIHGSDVSTRNHIFDDEFYYREGLPDSTEHARRTPVPSMVYNPKNVIDKTSKTIEGITGGSKCPRTVNNVI